ncbi:MAG: hypothetical protein IPH32_09975 [Bacteroidetes bacterium]|nr:hypothetical protein [Bacteroidota bacterium]
MREVKGFAYGARGGFSGNKFVAPSTIGAGVKANTTDSSLVIIMDELKKIQRRWHYCRRIRIYKKCYGASRCVKIRIATTKIRLCETYFRL